MLEHGSFKIEVINQVIFVRFFGAWNNETSIRMCREFQTKAKPILGKPWACLVDLREWELGGPEVWDPIVQVNHWCTENGQEMEAVVCEMEVQKYIMKKTHAALPITKSSFFRSEKEAKDWLNEYGYRV